MDIAQLRPAWNQLDETDQKYVVFLASRLAEDHPEAERQQERVWLTVQDVADYTGVSVSAVRRAVMTGQLPSRLPRGMTKGRRVLKSDVDEWMEGD